MSLRSTNDLAKVLWDYNNLHQNINKADVIITLGSHDTLVAERGASLYLQGLAPLIVFSGGFGRLTLDWRTPEAEVFAKIALKMGVPPKSILIEKKSTNTEENLRFSIDMLKSKGTLPKSVILVHQPYMERRQFATWKKLYPEISVYITSPQVSFDDYSQKSGIPQDDIINVIVGDTQRIKLYPAKGYMIYQEIPSDVWEAYKELVTRGFTTQLVS